MDDWLIIVLVSVPTIVALYYMVKANRAPKDTTININITTPEDQEEEWDFKQHRTN